MVTLRMLDARPPMKDGTYSSEVRCDCLVAANLRAVVKDGQIVFAGCPVCRKEAVIEVLPDGAIGFFPMGVVVI